MNYKDFNWVNEKFLIAEDDLSSCLLFEKILSKTGVKMRYARDGYEALEIIKSDYSITLAIIDIIIPKLSGHDLVESAFKIRPDIIYIACSADAIRLDTKRCSEIGFYTCMLKPILPDKLVKVLDEALTMKKQINKIRTL
jgi:DNA-binding NtrC family response regulator